MNLNLAKKLNEDTVQTIKKLNLEDELFSIELNDIKEYLEVTFKNTHPKNLDESNTDLKTIRKLVNNMKLKIVHHNVNHIIFVIYLAIQKYKEKHLKK